MSAPKEFGIRWPISTLLIFAFRGGLDWWGYAKLSIEYVVPRTEVQSLASTQADSSPDSRAVMPATLGTTLYL